MKKIFFSLASVAIFTLSSFTVNSKIEKSMDDELQTIPCRWRTVYYHSNGNVSYSEWTYGNCNHTESGTLIPIE